MPTCGMSTRAAPTIRSPSKAARSSRSRSSGGTCAEYALAPDTRLAAKPANLTFEQAAAVPTSALAALHGLRDAGGLQRGQTVLINGAAGGVGSFAVQIAKVMGAYVTGVCSTRNVDLIRSLGADAVIDYTREDFTDGRHFDVVFDNVENRSLSEDRRALTARGTLVLNSGSEGKDGPLLQTLGRLLWPLALSPFVRHNLRRFLSTPNAADLAVLQRVAIVLTISHGQTHRPRPSSRTQSRPRPAVTSVK